MRALPERLFIVAFMPLVFGCGSGADRQVVTVDPTYGYTEENPIKVGGFEEDQGPDNEQRFLESLRGPKGQRVRFERNGHCCPFATPASELGLGFLDVYEVTYDGLGVPVKLYINMYDKDKLQAPKGFSY